MGIESNQKAQFSAVNVLTLILFTYCTCAMVAFLLFEPNKTFFDVGNVFFGVLSQSLNTSTLLSNIMKRGKIFKLFENFEEVIKKRKFVI